jgi:hypothetical protein
MTHESPDVRYVASVLLLCFTALSATLAALFASAWTAWIVPVGMGVLTVAHGFEDRQKTDPHPGVGE